VRALLRRHLRRPTLYPLRFQYTTSGTVQVGECWRRWPGHIKIIIYLGDAMIHNRVTWALLMIGLSGCTHTILRHSTVHTAQTITDLEYQMVLSNLAMAKCRPGSLPWHLKITQGSVQVSDSVDGSLTFVWPHTTRTPATNASRGVSESWTVVPETDPKALDVLRQRYALALQTFDRYFESGTVPPFDRPYGHFGSCAVWVREDGYSALLALTVAVMDTSPVQAGDRALQLPALQIGPR
jgi:hypothetical protein